MASTTGTFLGEGRLNWTRYERIGDRYGAVMLQTAGGDFDGLHEAADARYAAFEDAPFGRRGRLVAEVVETRPSPHIGDLFHGFEPGGATVGARIVLGEGTLFDALREHDPRGYGWEREFPGVGLFPDDGRDTFWLDPKALYRCHEQTVRLDFEELSDGLDG